MLNPVRRWRKEDEYRYSFFAAAASSIPSGIKETQIEDYFDEDEYLEAAKKLFVELEQQHLVPAHPGKGITPLKFPKLKIPEVAAYRYVRLLAKSEVNGGRGLRSPISRCWSMAAHCRGAAGRSPPTVRSRTTPRSTRSMAGARRCGIRPGDRAPVHPHWLRVDLGSPQKVSGFRYQPRQDMPNGRIADYEFPGQRRRRKLDDSGVGPLPEHHAGAGGQRAGTQRKGAAVAGRALRALGRQVGSERWGGDGGQDFQLLLDGKPLDRSGGRCRSIAKRAPAKTVPRATPSTANPARPG